MRKVPKNSPVMSWESDTPAFLANPLKPGPSAVWESVATLIAERPPMVSRLKGSATFLAARMNFCRAVRGRGVAESRNRLNMGTLGWQLMIVSAGLEESGRHSERTPKMLGRAAGGTGIRPGAGGLMGGNPGRLFPRWPGLCFR